MSTGTQTLEELDGAGELLDGARFELMPFESFEEEIRELPDGATIAVTTSNPCSAACSVRSTVASMPSWGDVVTATVAPFGNSRISSSKLSNGISSNRAPSRSFPAPSSSSSVWVPVDISYSR